MSESDREHVCKFAKLWVEVRGRVLQSVSVAAFVIQHGVTIGCMLEASAGTSYEPNLGRRSSSKILSQETS